ncbi:MAG: histidine phosphatase family protein [Thermovirgaceae bacterium]
MRTKTERTRIILVRHGECKGNREGLFRGRSDFPLNDAGLAQAKALSAELARLFPTSGVYSGPLSRAQATGAEIARAMGVSLEIREGLNNMSLGPWEGRPKSEIREEHPEEWNLWLSNPERLRLEGAETLDDVRRRAFAEVNRLVKSYAGETFVVVTHRAVLKPVIAAALKIASPYFWRIHVDTASYSVLTHEESRGYCLVSLNQTHHLPGLVSEWV